MNRKNNSRRMFSDIFRDKDGRVVIAQTPNLAAWVWILGGIASLLIPHETYALYLRILAYGAAGIWAWLELRSGANTFRKLLGIGVLLWLTLRLIFALL